VNSVCEFICTADGYEENDTPDAAYAISLDFADTALTICDSEEDWFSFDLIEGHGYIFHLGFEHASGDIDAYLYTAGDTNNHLVNGYSASDDEHFTYVVPAGAGGSHLILVNLYGSIISQQYDLSITDAGVPACTADNECNAGEICEDFVCFTGCRQDSECAEGEICEDFVCFTGCRQDSECAEGEICEEFACITGCHHDGQCAVSEICEDLQCIVGCRNNSDCAANEICDANSTCVVPECLSGQDCATGQLCIDYFCVDFVCDNDNPCPWGLTCDNGTCVECIVDEDCPGAVNFCVNSFCEITCTADGYEENDTSDAAADITLDFADTALTLCDSEEDWFSFDLIEGHGYIFHLGFEHAGGDIDAFLYPAADTSNFLVRGYSGNDDEDFTYAVPSGAGGTYLIQVNLFGSGINQQYDLSITDAGMPGCLDDAGCNAGEICEGFACIIGCRQDTNCAEGEICEEHVCITGCRWDNECATGEICEDQICITGCRSDGDCAANEICDANHTCVVPECLSISDCAEGQICTDYACVDFVCDIDNPCPWGLVCDNGACVECITTDDCPNVDDFTCVDSLCVLECAEDSYHPNQVYVDAATVTLPFADDTLTLCGANSEDWFSLTLEADHAYAFAANFVNANGDLNMYLYHESDMNQIVAQASTWNDNEELIYATPSGGAGLYFVRLILYTHYAQSYELLIADNGIIDCIFDGDCNPGDLCINYMCITPECSDHNECSTGELCMDYQCVPFVCDIGNPCPPDLLCDNGTCVECITAGDCPNIDDFTCVDSFCVLDCIEDSYHPNHVYADAATIPLDFADNTLTLCGARNEDWYSLTLEANHAYAFTANFAHADGDVDLYLYHESNMNQALARGTTSTDNENFLFMTPSDGAGLYFIRVYLYNQYVQSYELITTDNGIIECTVDGDCVAGEICEDFFCITGCRSDNDCAIGDVCSNNLCITPECIDHNECDIGEICLDLQCLVFACDIDNPCPLGLVCDNGSCVECITVDDCPNIDDFTCVDSFCALDCTEDTYHPNHIYADAAAITLPFSDNTLTLCGERNEDWFSLTLEADRSYAFTANFLHADGDVDLYLYHESNMSMHVDSATSVSDNEEFIYTTPADGAGLYFVRALLFDHYAQSYELIIDLQ